MTSFQLFLNTSVSGDLTTFFCSWAIRKIGVSSICTRTTRPTITRIEDNRNGTRQPQASIASLSLKVSSRK